jgi:hypothetical protein
LYYVPYHAPIHPGRVLTTFGFISAIVEALNGWGASLSANQSLSNDSIETGHALIKASLLVQIVVIVCFVVLAVAFHRSCIKTGQRDRRVLSPLITLYISMTLIMIRTIYRTVEYFGVASINFHDPDLDHTDLSPLIRHEWYFYVFEASLMLANSILWNMRHPRRYLPENNKIYLSVDGITEVEGPGYRDPRPFWQTLVDPFNIAALLAWDKGASRGKFWESANGEQAAAKQRP